MQLKEIPYVNSILHRHY